MNNEIIRNIELFNPVSKKWEPHMQQTGETAAYNLASDLSAKYLEKAAYIKSVKRVQKYTHKEIIVTYDNECRAIYTVNAHF